LHHLHAGPCVLQTGTGTATLTEIYKENNFSEAKERIALPSCWTLCPSDWNRYSYQRKVTLTEKVSNSNKKNCVICKLDLVPFRLEQV